MKTVITHNNFTDEFSLVKNGEKKFYVPTYTRCTVIDAKTISKFEKVNLTVIAKSKDGKGFLMASGRKLVYVLPGMLISQ